MSDLICLARKRDERFKTIFLGSIEDDRLSWRAKGLHLYLMTRPPHWKIRHKDLLNRGTEGKTALQTAIKELQEFGYLVIEQVIDHRRRFIGSVWHVTESPSELPIEVEPHPCFPDTGCPETDYPRPDTTDCSNDLVLGSTTSTNVSTQVDTSVENDLETKTYSDQFEALWAIWLSMNRGVAKLKAARQWNETIRQRMNGETPEDSAARLIQSAKNYRQVVRRELRTPDKILHAATFLGRDMLWQDYEKLPPPPKDAGREQERAALERKIADAKSRRSSMLSRLVELDGPSQDESEMNEYLQLARDSAALASQIRGWERDLREVER